MKHKISALMFVLGVLLGGTAVFFFVRPRTTAPVEISEPVSENDTDAAAVGKLEEADTIPDTSLPAPGKDDEGDAIPEGPASHD